MNIYDLNRYSQEIAETFTGEERIRVNEILLAQQEIQRMITDYLQEMKLSVVLSNKQPEPFIPTSFSIH
jgi:hypothetical protein